MASRGATVEPGVLVRQWTWPLRVCCWCLLITIGAWGFTVAAHWAWARHSAPEAPIAQAEAVLAADRAALATLQPGLFDPGLLARRIGDALHGTVVQAALTGARALMNVPNDSRRFFTSPRIRDSRDAGGDFVREQLVEAGDAWRMVVVGTQLFAVRTAVVAAALPLVLLALALGATDGLVARARRKACAGRESASLYHRAKLGLSFAAIMGYLLCLGLPALTRPAALLLPLGIGLGALVRLQCAYYKKYL